MGMQRFQSVSSVSRDNSRSPRLSQIKVANWPHGVEEDAAVIAMEPREITRRTGASFEAGRDGLDRFEAAIVRLQPNFVVAFQRYENYPVAGTKVIMAKRDMPKFSVIRRMLNLQKKDFLWASDDIAAH